MNALELMTCIITRPLFSLMDKKGFLRLQRFQTKDVIRNHVYSYLLEINQSNETFDFDALHSRLSNELKWVRQYNLLNERILAAQLHQGLSDLNQVHSYTQNDLEGMISRRRGLRFQYIPRSPEYSETNLRRAHGF